VARSVQYDDVVIGAGIVGLAHTYQLARRGRRVIVLDRGSRAYGASVRNFGMLWPIGQPFGPVRALAGRSLEIWLEVLGSSGSWHDRIGSLHLAYHDDEEQILREFERECTAAAEPVDLLGPDAICQRVPAVNREGLRLGLFSPRETCVDPRETVANIPTWLARRFGVEFRFDCTATAVDAPAVVAGAHRFTAARVWICSGDELGLLFADHLNACGLMRCKLQMMRSQAFPETCRIGPMLASGLTLRHYEAFRNCPTRSALCERIARESPWFDRYGIHVMVSQNGLGELTIGDSHEYGPAIEPFNKSEVDELILDYLKTFLVVPGLRIAARWHGTYAKHPARPYVVLHPDSGVTAVTGLGGAGMTLSFGLAEAVVARELGEAEVSLEGI
jgi:D-hydroxyproline dehydrogenase subunit beta